MINGRLRPSYTCIVSTGLLRAFNMLMSTVNLHKGDRVSSIFQVYLENCFPEGSHQAELLMVHAEKHQQTPRGRRGGNGPSRTCSFDGQHFRGGILFRPPTAL